jgi:hypothetical protein
MNDKKLQRLYIIKPLNSLHEGSCFRELIDLWRDNDLCDVYYNSLITSIPMHYKNDQTLFPESRVWVNKIYDILMYDNTLCDILPSDFSFGLFANEIYKGDKLSSNWIFWPRYPKQFESFRKLNKLPSFEERKIESIFIGNVTTPKRVEKPWTNFVECCNLGHPINHVSNRLLVPYQDYLKFMVNSKFSLSLQGVGPKTLRDIEAIGLGCVPIFTPGISIDYYNPLVKDKHFLYVEEPEQIPEVIKSCSKEQWEYISNNCLEWYEKNCSIFGSYSTTIEILEKNNVI